MSPLTPTERRRLLQLIREKREDVALVYTGRVFEVTDRDTWRIANGHLEPGSTRWAELRFKSEATLAAEIDRHVRLRWDGRAQEEVLVEPKCTKCRRPFSDPETRDRARNGDRMRSWCKACDVRETIRKRQR